MDIVDPPKKACSSRSDIPSRTNSSIKNYVWFSCTGARGTTVAGYSYVPVPGTKSRMSTTTRVGARHHRTIQVLVTVCITHHSPRSMLENGWMHERPRQTTSLLASYEQVFLSRAQHAQPAPPRRPTNTTKKSSREQNSLSFIIYGNLRNQQPAKQTTVRLFTTDCSTRSCS